MADGLSWGSSDFGRYVQGWNWKEWLPVNVRLVSRRLAVMSHYDAGMLSSESVSPLPATLFLGMPNFSINS